MTKTKKMKKCDSSSTFLHFHCCLLTVSIKELIFQFTKLPEKSGRSHHIPRAFPTCLSFLTSVSAPVVLLCSNSASFLNSTVCIHLRCCCHTKTSNCIGKTRCVKVETQRVGAFRMKNSSEINKKFFSILPYYMKSIKNLHPLIIKLFFRFVQNSSFRPFSESLAGQKKCL